VSSRLCAWILIGSAIAAAPACGKGSPDAGRSSGSRPAEPRPASSTAADAAPGAGVSSQGPEASSASGTEQPTGSEAPSKERGSALDALAEARKLQLQTALHDVHVALIAYYAENTRYPADRPELEADPALAAALGELDEAGAGWTYSSDGGSFRLTVEQAGGPPITLSANNQKFRRTPPPAAGRPAGT
jgi:hypothetical protein